MAIGSIGNWIGETFNAEADPDDIVKARSLNITRITGVVAPLLLGIATAIGEVVDQPPFDNRDFQRQLILASIALVALVSVADIIGRSITATRATASASTVLPKGLRVTKDAGVGNTDIEGTIVAFSTSNASGSPGDGQYLFVDDDGAASWEPATSLAPVSS